jgi:hypothetical protein
MLGRTGKPSSAASGTTRSTRKITLRALAERTRVAHTTYSRDPARKAQVARV